MDATGCAPRLHAARDQFLPTGVSAVHDAFIGTREESRRLRRGDRGRGTADPGLPDDRAGALRRRAGRAVRRPGPLLWAAGRQTGGRAGEAVAGRRDPGVHRRADPAVSSTRQMCYGVKIYDPADLAQIVVRHHALGRQIAIHGNGDERDRRHPRRLRGGAELPTHAPTTATGSSTARRRDRTSSSAWRGLASSPASSPIISGTSVIGTCRASSGPERAYADGAVGDHDGARHSLGVALRLPSHGGQSAAGNLAGGQPADLRRAIDRRERARSASSRRCAASARMPRFLGFQEATTRSDRAWLVSPTSVVSGDLSPTLRGSRTCVFRPRSSVVRLSMRRRSRIEVAAGGTISCSNDPVFSRLTGTDAPGPVVHTVEPIEGAAFD